LRVNYKAAEELLMYKPCNTQHRWHPSELALQPASFHGTSPAKPPHTTATVLYGPFS